MRALAAGSISGILGGMAAGLAARIAMRAVALGFADSSMQVPEFTVAGTAAIVVSGALAGAPFGVLHQRLAPLLPGPRRLRGLVFGVLLLVALGPLFFTGIEEFFNEGRALVFVWVFPVYGMAVGLATEPSDRIVNAVPGTVRVAAVLFAALSAGLIAFGTVTLAARSAEIYGPVALSLFVAWAIAIAFVLMKRRRGPVPIRAL